VSFLFLFSTIIIYDDCQKLASTHPVPIQMLDRFDPEMDQFLEVEVHEGVRESCVPSPGPKSGHRKALAS